MGRYQGEDRCTSFPPSHYADELVQLEEIASSDESTGAVALLDGAGGILPDGEQTGLFLWWDYLKQAARSPAGKRKAVRVLFGATNFSDKTPPIDPLEYDFDAFDMGGTRKAIRDALDSKGSLPYASKKFVTPFAGMDEMNSDSGTLARVGRTAKDMKKGTAISKTRLDRTDGTFLEEGVNLTRKDNPANTTCANCGTPHGLKACSQCGQRYYCSKECQRVRVTFCCLRAVFGRADCEIDSEQQIHWKEGHKLVCKKKGNN